MPHNSLLVINADGPETRVALVQDGYLGELYIERKRERGIAGSRLSPGVKPTSIDTAVDRLAEGRKTLRH